MKCNSTLATQDTAVDIDTLQKNKEALQVNIEIYGI